MVSALFDTNILIDYLNGVEQAKTELERYRDKAISVITWMEVGRRNAGNRGNHQGVFTHVRHLAD